jgi:hypothetical protein
MDAGRFPQTEHVLASENCLGRRGNDEHVSTYSKDSHDGSLCRRCSCLISYGGGRRTTLGGDKGGPCHIRGAVNNDFYHAAAAACDNLGKTAHYPARSEAIRYC